MLKKLLAAAVFVWLLLPTLTFAAAPPATGTNWLLQITTQVDALTTTHGDALVGMGVIELNFVAMMGLIAMVARWNLAHYGYRLPAGEFHDWRSNCFPPQSFSLLRNAALLFHTVPRHYS
jgi:hypothetical protein